MEFEDTTLANMDEQMKKYHEQTGLSAIPYSSQAQGLFAKWETQAYTFQDDRINKIYLSTENVNRYERARKIAEQLSVSITQVSLGYLLSQTFHTFRIIGCRTLDQLEESLKAESMNLDEYQLRYLETGV